jgi:hypothetical protein
MTDAPVIDLTNVPKPIGRARTAAEAQRNVQQRKRGSSQLIVPPVVQAPSIVDVTATPKPIVKPTIQSKIIVNPEIPSAKPAPIPIDTSQLPKKIMKPEIRAALTRDQIALKKVVDQLKTMTESQLRAKLASVSERDLQEHSQEMEITPHQGGSYTVPQMVQLLYMTSPEYQAYQEVYEMAVQENFDMEEANQFEPWAPDPYNWDLGPPAGDEGGATVDEPTDPMDGQGDAGFDDAPADDEPVGEEPVDLGAIGEIVEPISDEQLLIVGVRGLQKYFKSDVALFVKNVEALEQLAESVQDASAKQISTGQQRLVYNFAMTTGYSATFAESVVTWADLIAKVMDRRDGVFHRLQRLQDLVYQFLSSVKPSKGPRRHQRLNCPKGFLTTTQPLCRC